MKYFVGFLAVLLAIVAAFLIGVHASSCPYLAHWFNPSVSCKCSGDCPNGGNCDCCNNCSPCCPQAGNCGNGKCSPNCPNGGNCNSSNNCSPCCPQAHKQPDCVLPTKKNHK